jgi:hypothetical protein
VRGVASPISISYPGVVSSFLDMRANQSCQKSDSAPNGLKTPQLFS